MIKISFTQKLWLPLLIGLLALFIVLVLNAYSLRQNVFAERQLALKNIDESALSIVKDYAALAAAGTLTIADAQKQALDRIKTIRYGTDGYVAVLGPDQTFIMHPINPKLLGIKSFAKDLYGKPLFGSFVNAAQKPDGGLTEYLWPRVGATEGVLKASYSLAYQPWNWYLFTGVYMDDIDHIFKRALYQAGIIFLLVGAVLGAITTTMNRSIQRLLGGDPAYATEIANRICRNDLTLRIDLRKGDDRSLIYSMKRMRDSLLSTMAEIQLAANIIDGAASDIATGNLDLSARTEAQAGALEETASAMEELTSTVSHNAGNARQANQLAMAASGIAGKGGGVVQEVIETMGSIDSSSKKIVDIIGVIDSIAFQTNILALNAAVEAARAGPEGRGFAVVASEVRSLAARSADAAKQIKALINDSQAKVATGAKLVLQAGTTMIEIVDSVKNVSGIVSEISVASQEQSNGIAEIGHAVASMDRTTQQNAVQVEQVAMAAQSLRDQAGELARLVSQFRLKDDDVSTLLIEEVEPSL